MEMNEENTLALTMVGEARGEGYDGMFAVGCTVPNRVKLQGYRGLTVIEVCLHPFAYSCWNKNDPNRAYLLALPETNSTYLTALSIAKKLLAGNYIDTTNGATYYYRAGSPIPNWAVGKTPCAVIGKHLFFKDIA